MVYGDVPVLPYSNANTPAIVYCSLATTLNCQTENLGPAQTSQCVTPLIALRQACAALGYWGTTYYHRALYIFSLDPH